jgi:hypothetical protein
MEHPHCHILAASEGFSRATTSPTPELYLSDANPLFFPAGELLSKSVEIGAGDSTYQSVFITEIFSPSLGFCWPTDIGLDTFVKSLEFLGRQYKPFLLTIDALQPRLATWFSSVSTNPTEFAILACSYASLEATTFPSLTDGIYPPTIIDHHSFSSLMDMRYGLVWRLHCDQVLTITAGPGLQHLGRSCSGAQMELLRIPTSKLPFQAVSVRTSAYILNFITRFGPHSLIPLSTSNRSRSSVWKPKTMAP